MKIKDILVILLLVIVVLSLIFNKLFLDIIVYLLTISVFTIYVIQFVNNI